MSEFDRTEMLRIIQESTKKLQKSRSKSVKFLTGLGMLTKTGKLKKDFKCTPSVQA